MDRRRFLLTSAVAAASFSTSARSEPTSRTTTITLHPNRPGPTVPRNFIGLSYETQQLSDPSFFSSANTGLIEQVRALAPDGVLRIGGNTSDVAWWKQTPESKQPPLPTDVFFVAPRGKERPFQELIFPVTPDAIVNLRDFLDASGWTCIYGLNLGTGTPARAAEEAVFVASTLGPRLEYFQVGNEPENFISRFRDRSTWTPDVYFDEWLAAVHAIRARLPDAKFGVPDVSEHPEWIARVADRLAALPDHSFVAAITHHHYFGGPPSNPDVTIDSILHSQATPSSIAEASKALAAHLGTLNPRALTTKIVITQTAAARLGTPYRVTEANSCWGGGKPGVSDVFAASLWAADYMLTLASAGYAGLNMHGGDGRMVANSLGGRLPGDDLVHDDPATHPHPYYTPIAHMGDRYVAEPVSYGMRFAGAFAGATILPIDFDPGPVNATAFAAALAPGKTLVAVLNKDPNALLTVMVNGFRSATVHRLTARSLDSREVNLEGFDTTFGRRHTTVRGAVSVPAASGALIFATQGD